MYVCMYVYVICMCVASASLRSRALCILSLILVSARTLQKLARSAKPAIPEKHWHWPSAGFLHFAQLKLAAAAATEKPI